MNGDPQSNPHFQRLAELLAVARPAGGGWLTLVGGGEFSFEETEAADEAWLAHTPPGQVGFLPTASGSEDYGRHFAVYLDEYFERQVETIPIYRPRDARRGKNLERLGQYAALYLGGGVPEHLLDAVIETPAAEKLRECLESGIHVVAIATSAQCLGGWVRSLKGGEMLPGLAWLSRGVIEPNFDPHHDRRFRQLMSRPGVEWGLGIPPGSAVLIGPEGELEIIGAVCLLEGSEGDLTVIEEEIEEAED